MGGRAPACPGVGAQIPDPMLAPFARDHDVVVGGKAVQPQRDDLGLLFATEAAVRRTGHDGERNAVVG